MGSKVRKFRLTDGSEWTTPELAKKIGCSVSTAYHRLTKSKDPASVLRPRALHKVHNGLRIYILDDGTEWTSRSLAEHLNIKQSTASTRLSMYSDPKKVMADPATTMRPSKGSEAIRAERMYNDPDGHWKLIMRATS